ncbi:MAG: hypothetical protein QOE93_1542, partial [Actinomycetota bacterium]|nr:hypothetical protein [Actinomycetota bacterium]
GKDEVKTSSSSTSSTVAGGSTTTSTVDPSASTTTVADEGTSPTTQVPGPGTTAAPVVTAPPATPPPGPVALTPPAPGLYSYATSGQTTITPALIPPIPYPPVSTNRVDPAAGTRQHMLRNLQDGAGNGSLVDYIFDYRPDGVYLESLRFTVTFSGQSNVQDLTPPAPLLFLATGAGPGASRTLTIPTGGGSAQVVVDVPRTEPVIIGGRSIDTLVVRSVATLPAGAVTGTQTLTVNLDPASRLWLKESGTGDATAVTGFGTFRVQSQYGATIESITPR